MLGFEVTLRGPSPEDEYFGVRLKMKNLNTTPTAVAALLQALLGLCIGGLGFLGLRETGFDDCWFGLYSALGLAEVLLALPLALRVSLARPLSVVLLVLNPVLPLLQMGSAYSRGSLHGSELSLLLLLVTLPGTIGALALLRGSRVPPSET